MNKVLLIGRITRDVELRHTQSGIPSVVFSLAVDRGYKDANGFSTTDFISCVAWRQQADFMAQYVKKGYKLAIEGQLQTRTYQNQQGQTVYLTEVICDRVENLQPKEEPQQQYQQPNQYQAPQYQGQQYQTPQYQGQAQQNIYQQHQQTPTSYVSDDDLPF